MFSIGNLNEEQVKKYARIYTSGETLFHQNQLGNTMFIIVRGTIELLENRDVGEVPVGKFGPGQVLGEKAFLTEAPYRRAYTARAIEETAVLEFGRKNLQIVQAMIPDFATRILQIAAVRLDRANKVIQILRPFHPVDRFVALVLFLQEDSGQKTSDGVEIALNESDAYQIANLSKESYQQCLEVLVRQKILKRTKAGIILVDADALRQYTPDLKEQLAA